MKKLEKTLRKNQFDYELVERNENFAIYKQLSDNLTISFEVFKIKNNKETKIGDNIIEAGEAFPGNEDFGKIAWTYSAFVNPEMDKKEYQKRVDKAYLQAKNKFEIINTKEELKEEDDN